MSEKLTQIADRVQRCRMGERASEVYGTVHTQAAFLLMDDERKLSYAYIDAMLRLNGCCTKDDLASVAMHLSQKFNGGER